MQVFRFMFRFRSHTLTSPQRLPLVNPVDAKMIDYDGDPSTVPSGSVQGSGINPLLPYMCVWRKKVVG